MIRTVPSLKRKVRADGTGNAEKVTLDRVFGITTCSNSAFVSHPESGLLAYPAGCVIVIVDVKRNKQTHLTNASKKTIVSLSFCSDGRHIASGESGHAPAVRVWDIESGQQVAELNDHKFSVPCVAFSPNQKYLFSIGNQFDNMINVWNWKTGIKVASNKNTQKVNALCFSPDSGHAVSVGIRHVRFWYLQLPQKLPGAAPAEAVPLTGKIAPLGDLQNNNFACAVYPNERTLVVVTHSGILCQFNAENRQLQASSAIKTKRAYCLAASLDDGLLYVGCANGTIRVFNGSTLDYVGMLPRPHKLGVDLRSRVDDTSYVYGEEPDTQVCADTIALAWLGEGHVAATYSDHSVYVWNVSDLDRITKAASWLFHSSKIWGIDVFPADAEQSLIPSDSFITCSGDDTVRIWNFADSSTNLSLAGTHAFRNPFSKELLKIIYVDENYANLCDNESLANAGIGSTEMLGGGVVGPSPASLNSFVPFGSSSAASTPSTANAPPLPVDNRGVRCVTVSPDGLHISAGLRSGFIKIYDINNNFTNNVTVQAHDGEILALEYSAHVEGPLMLASGGRDRYVHVLNASDDYKIHQTFDTDHSSSITALKFSQKITAPLQSANGNGSNAGEEKLQMLLMSCSADKSILIRSADVSLNSDNGKLSVGQFSLSNNVGNKSTLYDMETEPTQRFVAVACQDRLIRVISIATGKLRCKYRGSSADDGTLVRFSLDPTGTLFASACSDKTVSIVDFYTGELLATVSGHSEQITGVKFLPDLKRFVTVSADSCIFVWRLSNELVKLLSSRLEELKQGIVRPLSIKAPSTAVQQSNQPPTKKLGATRSTSVEESLSSLAGNNSNGATSVSAIGPSSAMLRRTVFGGSSAMVATVQQNDMSNGGRNSATEKPTTLDQLPEWALKQLKETSVDDPVPAARPSTRAKWGDRGVVPAPMMIKTEESNRVEVLIPGQRTAWGSYDDDEEMVDEEEDLALMNSGGVVNAEMSSKSPLNSNWLAGGKLTSPPRRNNLWSHLPAAGPSSPRQSVTEDHLTSPTPPIDEEPTAVNSSTTAATNMVSTMPIGRSPSAHSGLALKAAQTPPQQIPLKKLLEQQQHQHLANNSKRNSDDPSVFKKPAPVDTNSQASNGVVRSSLGQFVRRSRTATDLAAALNNGTTSENHPPVKSAVSGGLVKPPVKIPAFMQPTMSSAAKNSRMPRSNSSTTIATVAQLHAMNGTNGHGEHQTSALARHSATNGHHSAVQRTVPQKNMFQSTPDLSSGLSASAAIASAIFSETDTEPEDNASSIGGMSDLHDRMISLPRSPAERKAYALRAMRQNRNRSGSESAIASSVKTSISATFDDDEDEPDSGLQDSGRSAASSVKSPANLRTGASPSPQTVQVVSPIDLDRVLQSVQQGKPNTLALPGDGFKSKVLANAMLRAASPLSSDSGSTTGTSNSESPGDILRRELEREKRALRNSPLASPPTVTTNATVVSVAPAVTLPKPTPTTPAAPSPLRRVPIVGIVHPSNPSTIPVDQGPLVRLIDNSGASSASNNDDLLKNLKAVTVIPELAENNVTSPEANLHPSAVGEISESPVSTRSLPSVSRRLSGAMVAVSGNQTPPITTGSPQPLSAGKQQRPSVVLISSLRRPLTSPSGGSVSTGSPVPAPSATASSSKPSPQQNSRNSMPVEHAVVTTTTNRPSPRSESDRTRDRSVSVENLSIFAKTNGRNGHHHSLLQADEADEIAETSSLPRNGRVSNILTNGTVADVGASIQQRKMAFTSMSVADLRNLPQHQRVNGSSMEPTEEQERIEDLITAWQGLTNRLVSEFDKFQAISRIDRSVSEERNRKRLLQVMLEARRQFDRCQERASEDLFS